MFLSLQGLVLCYFHAYLGSGAGVLLPGCALWVWPCLEETRLSVGVLRWRDRSPAWQGTRHGTAGLSTGYLTRAKAMLSLLLPTQWEQTSQAITALTGCIFGMNFLLLQF